MSPAEVALARLQVCRGDLTMARVAAQTAAANLTGARQSIAVQLVELLADAICHCERLSFITEADICADQADGWTA